MLTPLFCFISLRPNIRPPRLDVVLFSVWANFAGYLVRSATDIPLFASSVSVVEGSDVVLVWMRGLVKPPITSTCSCSALELSGFVGLVAIFICFDVDFVSAIDSVQVHVPSRASPDLIRSFLRSSPASVRPFPIFSSGCTFLVFPAG